MERIACIDIGTVTARLAVADVADSRIFRMVKRSTICNLGEGLSASGVLSAEACGRVLGAVDAYLRASREMGARWACCTLTSAARDASNSAVLLESLLARGLDAQIITGEAEGALTFLGVAQDFRNQRILVADNGGGSTELALGSYGSALSLELVRSTNVGCRRITELFLAKEDPPCPDDVGRARSFAAGLFAPVAEEMGIAAKETPRPNCLVVTGGTATSLVAIEKALDPYDPSRVHLARLSRETVGGLARRLCGMTASQRAQLPGLQPKRANVILGGTLAIDELMCATGFEELVVSESDLLFGLSICAGQVAAGQEVPLSWEPRLLPFPRGWASSLR